MVVLVEGCERSVGFAELESGRCCDDDDGVEEEEETSDEEDEEEDGEEEEEKLEPSTLVGHTAGQVEICTCSPCAINAYLANGFVFSPQISAPIFPLAVSATRNPYPSPALHVSFSKNVGDSLR